MTKLTNDDKAFMRGFATAVSILVCGWNEKTLAKNGSRRSRFFFEIF